MAGSRTSPVSEGPPVRAVAGALVILAACGSAPTTEVAAVEKVKARRVLEEAHEFHDETQKAIDEAQAAVAEAERVVAAQKAAAQREAARQREARLRASRSRTTAPQGSASSELLDRLASCESGMRPDAHSSTGKYHGAFQFALSTWHGMGMSGDPHNYSYAEQKAVVARIPVSAWGRQFPTCARKLGVA